MKSNFSRVMIVGTGSGCGKTTVTCALLKALKDRNLNIASFKCGPDYIDPMFHSEIIGTKSRNLDLFLCGENTVNYLLARQESMADLAVIEGVMGMYDGLGFDHDLYSANDIAKKTKTPEVLVVNVRGKSVSLLAEITGYLNFAENNLAGVILNHCTKGMYPIYKNMIEEKLNLRVFGYMPMIPEAEIGSRHLGLITAEEIENLKAKVDILGKTAESTLDVDGLVGLAKATDSFDYQSIPVEKLDGRAPRIGIAKDKAFCFYYQDNLELLEALGAELVPFSPMTEKHLPDNLNGLIFGGGYPEEYLVELSENRTMLAEIREAIKNGTPTYAECGGFMYLGETITKDENTYKLVGAITGNSKMTESLVRFGYKTLTANKNNLMCSKGDQIQCHEFHYSDTDDHGDGFTAEKTNGKTWQTVVATDRIFAGYPHLHLWSNLQFAKEFVRKCQDEIEVK
ncbi:cobyrinic acid a,c-diamide synthase [Clostridiales Family XIII bacterium PM5-7]